MRTFQCFLATIGLLLLGVTLGCDNNKTGEEKVSSNNKSEEHTHADGTTHQDHSHEGHSHGAGPHDGTIADWGGGKFHVELTVNHQTQEATVYILGTDEKTPVPIDAPEITLTIKEPAFTTLLKSNPQDGDPEGKASRFTGNHESLGIVREFEGSLSGVVEGTPYSGGFKEEAHDH